MTSQRPLRYKRPVTLLVRQLPSQSKIFREAMRAISDGDVGHLSPARYEHINPYGRYHFNVDRERGRRDLRRLRKPGEAEP